jgi:Domain of unknown function (DUF4279)
MVTFKVTFRVMSTELDPDAVSTALQLTPSYFHKRGDQRIGKSGRRYSDYSAGLWALQSSGPETATLDDHLSDLLNMLRDRARSIHSLSTSGYRIDIFVGVFGEDLGNLGFSISAEIIREISVLGLRLEFDIYD